MQYSEEHFNQISLQHQSWFVQKYLLLEVITLVSTCCVLLMRGISERTTFYLTSSGQLSEESSSICTQHELFYKSRYFTFYGCGWSPLEVSVELIVWPAYVLNHIYRAVAFKEHHLRTEEFYWKLFLCRYQFYKLYLSVALKQICFNQANQVFFVEYSNIQLHLCGQK